MKQQERLTAERRNGIKSGYWSPAKKEDLVQRLGAYEDTGLTPEEIQNLKDKSKPKMVRWIPASQSYFSAVDEAECFCPVCDSDVVEDEDCFCPACGQALKYHSEPDN